MAERSLFSQLSFNVCPILLVRGTEDLQGKCPSEEEVDVVVGEAGDLTEVEDSTGVEEAEDSDVVVAAGVALTDKTTALRNM